MEGTWRGENIHQPTEITEPLERYLLLGLGILERIAVLGNGCRHITDKLLATTRLEPLLQTDHFGVGIFAGEPLVCLQGRLVTGRVREQIGLELVGLCQ